MIGALAWFMIDESGNWSGSDIGILMLISINLIGDFIKAIFFRSGNKK